MIDKQQITPEMRVAFKFRYDIDHEGLGYATLDRDIECKPLLRNDIDEAIMAMPKEYREQLRCEDLSHLQYNTTPNDLINTEERLRKPLCAPTEHQPRMTRERFEYLMNTLCMEWLRIGLKLQGQPPSAILARFDCPEMEELWRACGGEK